MRFFPLMFRDIDANGGGGTDAPAAPAAPAPVTPPAIATVESALAEARARLEAGGSLLPPPEQPRAENGQFASEGSAEEGAPPAGEAPVPEASPETPPAGDAPDPALVVELPGRRPEDPPEIVTASSPEQAERFRQLVNGYHRGQEIASREARLNADREAMTMLEARLQLDPEGFLFDNIPKDRAASVALQVLLQPEVWDSINDMLVELAQSPDKRELARVTLENERLKNRDNVAAQLENQKAATRNANEIRGTIALMIPETLPEADQLALYSACQRDIAAYADRMGLTTIDPRDVPTLVAARFRAANLDPVEAAFRAQNIAPRTRTNAPSAPAAPAAKAPAKGPTGQQLVAASAAAKAAAVTAPPGGPVPSAAAMPAPPKGQTVEERIAWGRQNLKFVK